MQDLEEPLED